MKLFATFAKPLTLLLAVAVVAGAQSWTPIVNQPQNFLPGVLLQLRDGRILMHDEGGVVATDWWVLSPDAQGSYVNGTWSYGGALPSGYQPLYFGSQVMLDGKTVMIEGGEYNFSVSLTNGVWTTLGARLTYSGNSFTWVPNSPPAGWTRLGDAESVLLPNGMYMQANCCTKQVAIYNGPNSWTATGSVIQSSNDESGFTLLPSGKILTVDAKNNTTCAASPKGGAELYTITNPSTGVGTWACTGATPVRLYKSDAELGAAVLMYNGKVFQSGGNVVATAIYDPAAATWVAGPTPPGGMNQADGPSALEPNGKVLSLYSPGLFLTGCAFLEYDPNTNALSYTDPGLACPGDSSYYGHLMIVPTGQIMFTDFGTTPVAVYNPAPGVVAGVAAKILLPSNTLKIGSVNNVLYGTQLNGLSQNNAYGDDYQGDTNFPLVRLTSTSNGDVYYALTHDDSTHSIAPGTFMYTYFDVPATIPAGSYQLQSVTNGIGSNSVVVSVH
jgi:hypothetical protein